VNTIPDPDADVCSDDMHQPETSDALELVDVQLKKIKNLIKNAS
jgi:hypothetical protein